MMVELESGGGRTLFGGRPYRALRPAVREVGLALNPDAFHPGRTVQAHLQLYSAAGGVPKARIAEVLEVAGLSTQATVRCGRLDPGQCQRLSIAAALLGDPSALILDEPHALDVHGMSWFHALIRAYAAQGRTVLVAATDPDSLSGTADHVVVLRRDEEDGLSRVIASRSAAEVFDERRATVVQVRSPQAARLAAALEAEGARLAAAGPGALQVRGLDRARIGEVAHGAGVCLHELSEIGHDDDVFGLRPVPRQKEILSGLNRVETQETTSTWRSGVRLVSNAEIEEAEVVEPDEAEAVEPDEGAVSAATTGTLHAQATMTPDSQATASRAGAQATEVIGSVMSDALTESPTTVPGVGAETTSLSREPSADAEVQAGDAAAEARTSPIAGDEQVAKLVVSLEDLTASVVVAQSSGQDSAGDEPAPSVPQESASEVPSQTPASVTAEPPAEAITPKRPGTQRRSATFGLRWARSKPAASQRPAAPPAPDSLVTAPPTQPAVPFTVLAAPPAGQPAEADGMTPWRAVAARVTHHGHQQSQQVSVAEAAPAEQETSA
jgi:ABC-2 type transport system ATP-binding protein